MNMEFRMMVTSGGEMQGGWEEKATWLVVGHYQSLHAPEEGGFSTYHIIKC